MNEPIKSALHTELPEKFRYLFDDMEAEMASICEADVPIARLNSDIKRYELKIEEALVREKSASEQVTQLDAKIIDAEAILRSLDREKRLAQGVISGARYTQRFLKRLIAARETRICSREKKLLMWEAQKRLATIGRTLKQNTGKRGGGGIDIVKIE